MISQVEKKTFYQKYQDVMPRGAGALFFIQIFSTLAFSVLYSTLTLYTTNALKMSDMMATSITGSFVALNYFLHLLGGYIGGRYLSNRSLFSIGMLLQVIGCLLISIPHETNLIWGLTLFLGGSGLNVTCINCMVTQLFAPEDKRREAAFLWNYSGMNIGFFVGFSLGGYFQLTRSYQELFLLSALGNVIAFLLTIYYWRILADRDTSFITVATETKNRFRLIGITQILLVIFALQILLRHTQLSNQLILSIGALVLFILLGLSLRQKTASERNKMWGYIILSLSSLVFWTLYQLAPMGMVLFIDRNVDRHIYNILVAPQWFQNINTVMIIFGGPLLSVIFTHLRQKGRDINIPLQFSIALVLIGLSLTILPIGIRFANVEGLTNMNWVVASYILQSVGELFISPIGYAMVGQLAPLHLRGFMMGSWMMISGVAAILSDHYSKIALGPSGSTNPLITNQSYSHIFNLLGFSAILIGVIVFVMIPAITTLTEEKKSLDKSTKLGVAA